MITLILNCIYTFDFHCCIFANFAQYPLRLCIRKNRKKPWLYFRVKIWNDSLISPKILLLGWWNLRKKGKIKVFERFFLLSTSINPLGNNKIDQIKKIINLKQPTWRMLVYLIVSNMTLSIINGNTINSISSLN